MGIGHRASDSVEIGLEPLYLTTLENRYITVLSL